jgi:hypothetical protein
MILAPPDAGCPLQNLPRDPVGAGGLAIAIVR